MELPIKNKVRVILLNQKDELLLVLIDDPTTKSKDGSGGSPFWFLVGGGIEKNESMEEAAVREIFEETGVLAANLQMGPAVWFGEFEFILSGTPVLEKQTFFVAKTTQTELSLTNLTESEKGVVRRLEWFSLDRIKNSTEVIFPVDLPEYLPDIIAGNYPQKPLCLDLGKPAKKRG